ncbi:helix-turn-helix transcriptional regulator [Kutzneria sp. CA-103260]|uniref:helix-turn-helix transcriptional regulator n=1 Tax=Kutzneria sp. CA-103260 TaxID=2802641 RepID=UPI001BA5620A|nr:LuxR family transcriptional regulator [Kutzneria sp. CA-103260]
MSFVHRAEELAAFRAALADTRQGKGRVLLVTGPLAGGKTALLRRFCDDAVAGGAQLLLATGSRAERGLRMGVIDQLFRTPAAPAEIMEKARPLLSGEPSDASSPDDDPSTSQQSDPRTVRALCDLLLELANRGPLVIAIDDVHVADEPSLQVLLYLRRRVKRARILLVMTEWARPSPTHPMFRAEVMRLPHRHLNLGLLPPEAIADLVTAAGGPPVTAATARAYHSLTGGNPLLVGALVKDNPELGAGEQPVVGRAYRQAVLACLHRWEPRLLVVARAVAMLDGHATVDLVAALAGLPPTAVASELEVLTNAGLLVDSRFRHVQGTAAVLDAIAPAQRIPMHARAAEILYRHGAPAAEVTSQLIAAGAAPGAWAVGVLRESANQALTADNVEFVVEALELAASSCGDERERVEILLALVRALWWVNPTLAGLRLSPLLEALRENRLSAMDMSMVIRYVLWHGNADDHHAGIARVMAVDSATDDPVSAAMFLVGHQWVYGLSDECGCVAQAERLCADSPSPWIRAALSLRSVFRADHNDQVIRNASYILRSYRLGENIPEMMTSAVFVLMYAGRPDLAAYWCDGLIEEATHRGAVTGQALLTAARAEIAFRQGELENAMALARRALTVLPGPNWGVVVAVPLSVLVLAATALGRHDEAADVLGEPVPVAMSETMLGLWYVRARGHHYLATDQVLAAVADFAHCGALAQRLRIDIPELVPWRSDLAEAHLVLGNEKLAHDLVREQLELAKGGLSRARSLRVLAACSDPRERPGLLNEAIDALQEYGDRIERARAMAELSKAYDELGDFSRARTVARSADHEANGQHSGTKSAQVVRVSDKEPAADTPILSDAELRVARLAARGHTNREISNRLSITPSTVEQHLTRIYRKLNVNSRVDLPDRLSAPPGIES